MTNIIQAPLHPPKVPRTHPRLRLGDALLVAVHEGADGQTRLTLHITLVEELQEDECEQQIVIVVGWRFTL